MPVNLSIERTGYTISMKDYLTDDGRSLQDTLLFKSLILLASRYRNFVDPWNFGLRLVSNRRDWLQ